MKKWFYLVWVCVNVQATEVLLDFHPSTDLFKANPRWSEYASQTLIPSLNQLSKRLELPFTFKHVSAKNNPVSGGR